MFVDQINNEAVTNRSTEYVEVMHSEKQSQHLSAFV